MWLQEDSYIPNWGIVIVGLLLLASCDFYSKHQDDATKINEMQKEIDRLTIENNNQMYRIAQLEAENQELKKQRAEINEELTKYFTQEIIWDVLGIKTYRTICNIVKIVFRDDIPTISKFPC